MVLRGSGRRKARLLTLAELREQIQSIESGNHDLRGKWSAGQVFYHLAAAFEASIEGLPAGYPRTIRTLVRPFRWIITRVRFPPCLPIPNAIRFKLDPPTHADFDLEKSRLLGSIERFVEFSGQHPPHPVLGSLTRDEWIGFHLRHCQHHLSFVALKS